MARYIVFVCVFVAVHLCCTAEPEQVLSRDTVDPAPALSRDTVDQPAPRELRSDETARDAEVPLAARSPASIDNTIDLLHKSLQHLKQIKRDLIPGHSDTLTTEPRPDQRETLSRDSLSDDPQSQIPDSATHQQSDSSFKDKHIEDYVDFTSTFTTNSSNGAVPGTGSSDARSDGAAVTDPPVFVARDIRAMTESAVTTPTTSSLHETDHATAPLSAAQLNLTDDPDLTPSDLNTAASQPHWHAAHESSDPRDSSLPSQQISELTEPPGSGDDIPPFNEWALKKVEETQKLAVESSVPSAGGGGVGGGGAGTGSMNSPVVRHRLKNHASPDCSAKVLAANSEATAPHHILTSGRDEYMLNPCEARVWFIIELCEAVQVSRVEISNNELYSSAVQRFSMCVCDSYPCRDWQKVATVTADDRRGPQTFNISSNMLTKFIKFEVLSHYGTYYYCTLSSVRVFGANEYELLDHQDNINQQQQQQQQQQDYDTDTQDVDNEATESKPNLIHRAIDAVSAIVDTARQAITGERRVTMSVVWCVCLDVRYLPASLNNTSLLPAISCNWRELSRHLRQLDVVTAVTRCGLCPLTPAVSVTDGRSREARCWNDAACQLARMMWLGGAWWKLLCEAACIAPLTRPSSLSRAHQPVQASVDHSRCAASNSSSGADSPLNNTTVTRPDLTSADPGHRAVKGAGQVLSPANNSTLHSQHNLNNMTSSSSDVTSFNVTSLSDVTSSEGEAVNSTSSVADDKMMDGDEAAVSSSSSVEEDASQPVQKESVFVRLGSRIRVLERNMSLSWQYLDELSRRYRRQVDDMQRTFNKTTAALEFTARDAEARDNLQQEMIRSLQIQLMDLSDVVKSLVEEKEHVTWTMLRRHGVFVACEVVVLCVAIVSCVLRCRGACQCSCSVVRRSSASGDEARRRSTHHVTAPGNGKHRRHASDEVANISGTYSSLLIGDQTAGGDDVTDGASCVVPTRSVSCRCLPAMKTVVPRGGQAARRQHPACCSAGVLFPGRARAAMFRSSRESAVTITANQYSALMLHEPAVGQVNGHVTSGQQRTLAAPRSKKCKHRDRTCHSKKH